MMGPPVAHDGQFADRVIRATNATLGGHVVIEDHAILGGLSAIHQFVRIGHHAMIGGMSGVEHDVIPYGMAAGERARLQGLKVVGMKRPGLGGADILTLSQTSARWFGGEDTRAGRGERRAGGLGDADGDGALNCNDKCPGVDDTVFAPECEGAIPTTSQWGLVVLTLLLLTGGKKFFGIGVKRVARS